MDKVNVLVVGGGGREHALVWKLSQSAFAGKIFVAPGNAGTLEFNVPIASTDIRAICEFANCMECLTIVGPEAPLELGLIDALQKGGQRVFGPTAQQAQLETSKAFSKKFMAENGIPTANFAVFSKEEDALAHVDSTDGNLVVKADGLAAGKGVFVCSSKEEAQLAIRAMMRDKIFGTAGQVIVLEEKLRGPEVSLFAICDGESAIPFGTAVDHKRLNDGDVGPNTGGMGAYSPAEDFGDGIIQKVMENIVVPTVRKTRFRGFLYTGLMVCEDGPKVLEFNARLGDPETQVILPRLQTDLLEEIIAISNGKMLDGLPPLQWSESSSCGVVMCSSGYPQRPRLGDEISGLTQIGCECIAFHSGTKFEGGRVLTSGGRVICMTALGRTSVDAAEKAYDSANRVSWKGEFHRNDIGRKSNDIQVAS